MDKSRKLFQLWLIPVFFFLMSGLIFAEEIRISNHGATVAFISENGRIENSARTTIGYVDPSGRVENSGRSTLGYIEKDRVENASRSTVGYIDSSGRVENAGRKTIGYITSGRVENASRSTVLTFSGPTDLKKIGAYIFFFNQVLEKK
jgi:hypothetical protein